MAGKFTINKDVHKRLIFLLIKNKYRASRVLLNDLYLPIEVRYVLSRLYFFGKSFSNYRSQIKNRCILTGRSKAVYSFFKLTRMMFKNLAIKGYLLGVRKYSW